ncbi:MAG: cation diffusion facilitator family transporter [Byssovorax sp.]
MSGHGGGDPVKVIRAALYANLAIAACKFAAAYFSKSTATLAEAVHSLADTGNQALLFVGVRLATKEKEIYSFGRAMERYFWPFIVALLLFSLGGAFALYEGIHKALHPEPPDLSHFWSLTHGPLTSLIVLGISMVLEGYSCSVALREFRLENKDKPIKSALFEGKDPTIPLVLMEDISALVGLTLAFAAVGLSALTGSGIWDAVGSIAIGVLLAVVATLIARDTHSLLIGERATPEMEREAQALTESTEGVLRVTQLLTMHLGPDFIVIAMKVAFEKGMPVEKVEEVINEAERRIRARQPSMKKIFIEPDSQGDMRGVVELGSASG